MLLGYPVTICTADQLKIQRGRFFISNTDTSQSPGEHWVSFYFPKRGPFEFLTPWDTWQKTMELDLKRSLKGNTSKTLVNYSNLHPMCAVYTAHTML